MSERAAAGRAAIGALVLDFDGTVLDTKGPEYRAWAELYRETGCDLPLALWTADVGRAGR